MNPRRVRSGGCWRALVDSPLLVATWVAIVVVFGAVFEVAQALGRAHATRTGATQALAHAAAETALLRRASGEWTMPSARIGDVQLAVGNRAGEWFVTAAVDGRSLAFRAADLPGASPGVFERPCSYVDRSLVAPTVGCRIESGELPRLDERVLSEAERADQCAMLRRDGGVALLTFETGTERDDFVFDAARTSSEVSVTRDLVVVPGHLWIQPCDRPLHFVLQKDLVVVVRGNLYVGRSIEVTGRGRLVFATCVDPDAAVFADIDGNGRWSPGDRLRRSAEFRGPMEGTGNVYLGLRGEPSALRVDAGIVVAGEAHLAADAHVAGPVVLSFGVTESRSRPCRLVPEGRWSFQVEREVVPGFVVHGGRRPGVLRDAADPGSSREQALYVATPAR